MSLQKFYPNSPDTEIFTDSDMTVAKFGHLNTIVEYINAIANANQDISTSAVETQVDLLNGNIVSLTLQADTLLTFSNAVPGAYVLKLIQGDGTGLTVLWPANVKWSGAVAPTLSIGYGVVDVITLVYDGTNFYGVYTLNFI